MTETLSGGTTAEWPPTSVDADRPPIGPIAAAIATACLVVAALRFRAQRQARERARRRRQAAAARLVMGVEGFTSRTGRAITSRTEIVGAMLVNALIVILGLVARRAPGYPPSR